MRSTTLPGVAVVDEEGVPHRPRRMGGRHVQRLEVVPVALGLGAFGDHEAEPDEDVLETLVRLGDEVRVPAPWRAGELGEVEALGGQRGQAGRGAELAASLGEGGLDRGHRLVHGLPGRGPVRGSEAAEALLERRQHALLAEQLGVERLDLVEGGCAAGAVDGLGGGAADVVDHRSEGRGSRWNGAITAMLLGSAGRRQVRSPQAVDEEAGAGRSANRARAAPERGPGAPKSVLGVRSSAHRPCTVAAPAVARREVAPRRGHPAALGCDVRTTEACGRGGRPRSRARRRPWRR